MSLDCVRCRGTADERLSTNAAITVTQGETTSNEIRPIMCNTRMIRRPLSERIVVVNSMDGTLLSRSGIRGPLPGLIRSSRCGMSFITELGDRFWESRKSDETQNGRLIKHKRGLREASTNVACCRKRKMVPKPHRYLLQISPRDKC